MGRQDLLNAIVDDASTEVPFAYPRPDQALMREGATAGLEACRTLDDDGLVALLRRSTEARASASERKAADYWLHRAFEAQVEWVLGVLSAAADASGLPLLTGYTTRHRAKAADILGVAS